jgi:tripartite-type tricarboxylate transporter receptor subunit TctC
MTYDAAKDFVPVILLGSVPNVMLASPKSPYKSVADVVAAAKQEPGKIQYGTPGLGTSQHLSAENFKALTGTQITHVPYRGSPIAIMDLISGQIPLTFDTVIFAQPYVQSGQVRALAVTSAKRSKILPDVPTMQEAGIKGMDVESWQAIYAPAGTPRAVVEKMNASIQEILAMPDVKAKMESLGMNYTPNNAEQFAKFDASERVKWRKIVDENHLTLD